MKRFVISDHHFGHENILKFTNDGSKVRPGFSNVLQMNNYMIWQHNSVVSPEDKVYFLGDVAFNNKVFHEVMPRLNGNKSLILGNHDHFKMSEYYKYFKNIYSSRHIKYSDTLKFVLCHYPLHPDCNFPNYPICIHGHIHEKDIKVTDHYLVESIYGPAVASDTEIDNRYVNVSVEKINYTPISLDEIARRYETPKEE